MKSQLIKAGAMIAGTGVIGAAMAMNPATANDLHRFLKPDTTIICNSSNPCSGGTNKGGGPGVRGMNTNFGNGVYGVANNNDGVNGTTFNPSATQRARSGVFGTDLSTDGGYSNFGVSGLSTNGTGVLGYSTNGYGVIGEATNGIALTARADNPGYFVFDAYGNYSGGGYVLIDTTGNIYSTGLLYTAGNCHAGCAKTKGTDHRVVSYTPRESLPSMEDTGESRLVDGHAYVRIDPALANVIDSGAEFSVFITPEGDSRGLFVKQKSSNGFAVDENQGGRSSLSFAYRIVAKPYADASSRLPSRSFPVHASTSAQRDLRSLRR